MRPAVPTAGITALIESLVRLPSRAGDDPCEPVVAQVQAAWQALGLRGRRLQADGGAPLGLYAEACGRRPGPWTVLNAPLDTAGFGALADWTHPPTSGRQAEGWLHGRGSGDAKAAVALFSHLLAELAAAPDFAGRVGLLLDADEHSGRFGGARAFFDTGLDGAAPPRPDGVLIGYPGLERIVCGCRGFVRATLTLHGRAAHTGSARERGVNAVLRAVDLCQALGAIDLPGPAADFALPPQLTITGLHGGETGFTQVPDRCELRLDLRLTPRFDDARARAAVQACVAAQDARWPTAAPTTLAWHDGWPAYRLPADHPLVAALQQAATAELGQTPPAAVVGPSNIGNYLATLGIPALCGFGVRAENLHAADERIALDSLAPVYRIYRTALARLHAA